MAFDRRYVLNISGVVDKTAQMNSVVARQMLKDAEGPDLLAFIGRIGQAVTQEEEGGFGKNRPGAVVHYI